MNSPINPSIWTPHKPFDIILPVLFEWVQGVLNWAFMTPRSELASQTDRCRFSPRTVWHIPDLDPTSWYLSCRIDNNVHSGGLDWLILLICNPNHLHSIVIINKYQFGTLVLFHLPTCRSPPLKSGHIAIKDAQCAETNEEIIFWYLRYLVYDTWSILYSTVLENWQKVTKNSQFLLSQEMCNIMFSDICDF